MQACNLTWEVRVVGWDQVSYGAEFVPNAKDGYTVIIQKIRKVGPTEETIISNSFKSNEPGKVVLTLHNSSSKKKRLLYRLKSIPLSSSFWTHQKKIKNLLVLIIIIITKCIMKLLYFFCLNFVNPFWIHEIMIYEVLIDYGDAWMGTTILGI